jgi:hypothetical protein
MLIVMRRRKSRDWKGLLRTMRCGMPKRLKRKKKKREKRKRGRKT